MRILLAMVTLAAGTAAGAQPAPRVVPIVRELRLSAATMGTQHDPMVAVGPAGRLIATERYGWSGIRAFDSAGKSLNWKVPTGRDENAEIRYPVRMGWVGATNTTWIADAGFGQVVLVDATGKVTKSIEYPSWVHPRWADRRKYPLYASMDPLAIYPDSTMLVRPSRERSLIDTPGYDRSVIHLLRTTWTGTVQRTVAIVPVEQGWVTARGRGNSEHTIPIPFASRTFWGTSTDGARIVIVAPGTAPADSGTFWVTALSERGDTVYSRRFSHGAFRIPRATVDSFLAEIKPFGTSTAEQLRAEAMKQIHTFRSLVTGIVVGNDQSVWVMLRPAVDTAKERTALVLDARGDAVATVVLPPDEIPVAADRGHLWTMERGRNRVPLGLVRYRLDPTAAPPARTAPASASSRPSRPPA